jgi:hypothetical protein
VFYSHPLSMLLTLSVWNSRELGSREPWVVSRE